MMKAKPMAQTLAHNGLSKGVIDEVDYRNG